MRCSRGYFGVWTVWIMIWKEHCKSSFYLTEWIMIVKAHFDQEFSRISNPSGMPSGRMLSSRIVVGGGGVLVTKQPNNSDDDVFQMQTQTKKQQIWITKTRWSLVADGWWMRNGIFIGCFQQLGLKFLNFETNWKNSQSVGRSVLTPQKRLAARWSKRLSVGCFSLILSVIHFQSARQSKI